MLKVGVGNYILSYVAGELSEPRVVRGLRGCVRRGVPPSVQQGPGHRLPQPVPGRLRRGRGHRGVSGALLQSELQTNLLEDFTHTERKHLLAL